MLQLEALEVQVWYAIAFQFDSHLGDFLFFQCFS